MGFGDMDAAVADRFATYVDGLSEVIGHKDRVRPLRDYCMGLMLPCERKSVEPMAAVTAPSRTAAQHQSLLHFVSEGNWSDERVIGQGARDGAHPSAPHRAEACTGRLA